MKTCSLRSWSFSFFTQTKIESTVFLFVFKKELNLNSSLSDDSLCPQNHYCQFLLLWLMNYTEIVNLCCSWQYCAVLYCPVWAVEVSWIVVNNTNTEYCDLISWLYCEHFENFQVSGFNWTVQYFCTFTSVKRPARLYSHDPRLCPVPDGGFSS